MATPLPPEVLPQDYEAMGNVGGLLTPGEDYLKNIQSAYSSILQNAPEYQYFTAPLSNQGNTTASYGTTNQIVVAPDTQVRLVNNATGEVAYSGSGYQGAQAAIDAAKALSGSSGSKANWDIQVTRPGSRQFESVSTERPDVSGLGILADIALPVAGSLLAGPLGLGALGLGAAGTGAVGAALGSGISSAAQGRSIDDALLRAAIAGGGSYLGSQLFGPATSPTTTSTSGINSDLIPNALKGLNFGSIATTGVPAGIGGGAGSLLPSMGGDIVVNAIGSTAPSIAGGAFGSVIGSVPSTIPGNYQPGDIVVTAKQPTDVNLGGSIGAVVPANPPITQPPINPAEDITVTAKNVQTPSVVPPITIPPGIIPPSSTPTTKTTPSDQTTPDKTKGVLGTNMSVTDLLTLASLGVGGLGSLLSGSGTGSTASTPYVSPFGAMTGLGTGMDYRATPNIADYERYGFGPEASFFKPDYSRLVGAAAAAPTTAQVTSQTPTYNPLI